MTRKDFELIAMVVRGSLYFLTKKQRLQLAEEFAAELAKTNSAFKHDRFIEACTK